jgi:hypothetical protein
VRYVEMLATQGTTAPRPMRKPHTSITGFGNSKVIITGGTINPARKEVIILI